MMTDLDKRMIEAGMMTIEQMLAPKPLDKFLANADVIDMETFEQWLTMRQEEMLKLFIRIELDEGEANELYEWALAYQAVLGEVAVNFRQAKEGPVE